METYEKKYKELEGKIKKAYLYAQTDSTKAVLEEILPELKESEEEGIRKELKHYLEVRRCQTKDNEEYINCNHFLAWLEKPADNANKVASAWNNGYCNGYIQAVEKASEWLENHNDYIDVKDDNITYFDMRKCVEDFGKYMKGGEE